MRRTLNLASTMKIIGITGTMGSGKGTVVSYLQQAPHNYAHYSARTLLNEIIEASNMPPGRDSMRKVANEMREKGGPAALIEALYEKAVAVGQDAIIESGKVYTRGAQDARHPDLVCVWARGIHHTPPPRAPAPLTHLARPTTHPPQHAPLSSSAVRTEGEVVALRAKGQFTLLAVDADQRLRYDRVHTGRQSETDDVTFEKFCEQEAAEMQSTNPCEQNLSRCMELADAVLQNDGGLGSFHAQIEAFLLRANVRERVVGAGGEGYSLRNVVAVLEGIVPPKLGESWDNVGLLMDRSSDAPVERIMLTNDLTDDVLEEVRQAGSVLCVCCVCRVGV